MATIDAGIESVDTAVYRFPTAGPEADGTLSWSSTTVVVVRVAAAGAVGLGWSYTGAASATVITETLGATVVGRDAMDIAGSWSQMHRAARNLGTRGLVGQAISAVDIALWDLKARLLGVPLARLFGRVRDAVPVYGSGGFTTLDDAELADQVEVWSAAGCRAMKIKIGESWGRRGERDLARLNRFAELAGPDVALMVDANGGYPRAQARRIGHALDEHHVVWFEEPVSSADVAGLAAVRDAVDCDVTAGEYITDLDEARQLCPVVDCLQLDATRCGGYTGWFRAAAVAQAHHLDVSAHCAPALHAPVAASIPNLRHIEWFYDHMRVDEQLLVGAPPVIDGRITVGETGIGHGMAMADAAERFRVAPFGVDHRGHPA